MVEVLTFQEDVPGGKDVCSAEISDAGNDEVFVFPASFAQKRLWFLQELAPHSTAYNMTLPMRLEGAVDLAGLDRALGAVVERHESLRTTFEVIDSEVMQVISTAASTSLSTVDLTAIPAARREGEVIEVVEQDEGRPFDLTRGPLLRCALLRLAPDDHAAVITMHHIISDGWSLDVFFNELCALYEAFQGGRPSPLPELAIQYADFTLWQQEQLRGENLERLLEFWGRELADSPPELALPVDRPRSSGMDEQGAFASVILPWLASQRFKELSEESGTMLFISGLAAFYALLYRYTGEKDICIGTPVAGRERGETEQLIGFFVNTLVMRARLEGGTSFQQLVTQVREVVLDAQSHQALPFEKLVEELRPQRRLDQMPFFRIMFTFVPPAPAGKGGLEGIVVRPLERVDARAKFDLVLRFSELPGGRLHLAAHYARSLFDPTTVERLVGHMARLLELVVDRATTPISDLPLLSAPQRHQLLHAWNDTAADYPGHVPIQELFASRARRSPDATALIFGDERLSFRELDRRANRLAHHLRGLGVGPESLVGICLDRSPQLVAALLAVLKAGGSYVPLDPDYPRERLRFMSEDAGVEVTLTCSGLERHLPGTGRTLCLDSEAAAIRRRPADDPPSRSTATHRAYMMYTSGSTGTPKGIAVTHRSIARLVCNVDYARIVPGDVVAFASNVSFDAATFEVWGALLQGAGLVGITRQVALSPPAYAAALERYRVTTLFLTTALFNQLAAERPEAFRTLRHLLFGGQAVDPRWVRRVLTEGEPDRLLHVYGPTETTTFASWHRIARVDPRAVTVPIGGPLSNTALYVLDRHGGPVLPGSTGELFIGGDGVARGYHRRGAQTAERFVPDSFSGSCGERLYRTGDLVRQRSDGAVEFQRRVDNQVKIRGFRIEPGEIEARLREHPGVRESLVLVSRDAGGERCLIAYVTAGTNGIPSDRELRRHLSAELPSYFLPAAIVFLENLPLTPNGKVDREALPAPDWSAGQDHVDPRNPVEELVAGVFAEVLQLPRVSVESSFFELGGHSLMATQVISRLRSVFAAEVELRALFEHPTVAALAAEVSAALRSGLGGPPPLVPTPPGDDAPLSFAQLRLWFLDQLMPGGAVYNVPAALRLRGPLRVEALEHSLARVVDRHEVLRTVFVERAGEPRQKVLDDGRLALPLIDLSALDEERREAQARRLAASEAARPFDLARGPLLRAALLRLAEESHVALITLHHIVSDGWSVGLLVAEVTELYEAASTGRPAELPVLPIQYRDYARWHRGWLAGETLEAELGFWRRELDQAPNLIELPTDRPRPAVARHRGARLPFELAGPSAGELEEWSRRRQVTLFMSLLGALQVLLHRHSGQTDLVVGSPTASRTWLETESLIGFFVNTLVLRGNLSRDPSFTELVSRVREVCLRALAHQALPFEKLVEELHPERSLSHSPLFQVMFVLQNTPGGDLDLRDLEIEAFEAEEEETAKFDLSLVAEHQPRRVAGAFNYDRDLFDRATVYRMARHLQNVLREAMRDPGQRISRLGLLSPAEHHQLVTEWTESTEPGRCPTLDRLVADQAARSPEATVAVYGEAWLSSRRLETLANQLAHYLLSLGVGTETRVAICLERSLEMVVAVLGVLKAGGAYLPLDPRYPAARLAFSLEDAQAPVLVTHTELAPRLPETSARRVHLDADGPILARQPATAPRTSASAANAAYVIYTSGSTGRPKGVVLTHGNAVRLFRTTEPWYGFGTRDVWTLFHSYAFDFSVWELWGALLYGGRVVVVPYWVSRSPAEFAGLLRRRRVTVLNQTPSAFEALMEEAPASELPDLRWVIFGGEALDPRRLRPWWGAPSARRPALVNMYGITETTVHVTYQPLTPALMERAGSPVGLPLPDLRISLLDRRLRPVPLGAAGEIHVAGAGLARGYLRRAALTAERFLPDSLNLRPGRRGYRTGDLARYRPDRGLEFLGRIDQQVKIRGFRIELGEIEAVLAAHPAVRDVAVVARRDEAGQARLCAYLVPAGEAAPEVEELRRHVTESLPRYMVPAAFVTLPALPLTPSGKLDHKALPESDPAAAGAVVDAVPPRDLNEEIVAMIWSEVLGVGQVGAHADFFQLGGHSLLATRVMSRLHKAFEVELPLRALFEHPTVAGLAEALARARREGRPMPPPLEPVARDPGEPLRSLPLSFAQERLWFLDQLQGTGAVYNVPMALRLRGPLEIGALAGGLRRLVERHEVLRTVIRTVDGEPRQHLLPVPPVVFPVVDLTSPEPHRAEQQARRLAAEEAGRPFDLARGPLLRARLLRLREDEHVALLTLHHIVSDGWSMGLLTREISQCYQAAVDGRTPELRALPIQYADFAAWQRGWLRGEVLEAELGYWREQLAAVPELLELPSDRPRPAVQTYAGASREVWLERGLSAELVHWSRGHATTLFMTLLAGFQMLLSRHAGQRMLAVGTPIAGRRHLETENLIGFFVNTLVLRGDLRGDPSFADCARRVREMALGAQEHQDLPFEKLVEELQPIRSMSHTPLFQVLFALHNVGREELRLSELEVDPLDTAGAEIAKFDLSLGLAETDGEITGALQFNTDLFDGTTVVRLARHFKNLLSVAMADPGRPFSQLSLLPAAERCQLLVEWNDTEAPIPAGTLDEQVTTRVRRVPEAVALVWRERHLSYRDLDERAGALAGRLRQLGVGPEVVVGVLLERTPTMLVVLLGVLKAGGCYLPLDPAYPSERLAYVLDDSSARVLVSESSLESVLPPSGAQRVWIDRPAKGAAAGEETEHFAPAGSARTAYVIYTSGSTGRPKGVQIPHRALLNFLAAMSRQPGLEASDVLLAVTSLSFDIAALELYLPLLQGARVELCGARTAADGEALGELLERSRATIVQATPATWRLLLATGWSPARGFRALCGGEAMPEELAAALGRRCAAVWNLYGPTETTVWSATAAVADGRRPAERISIGRPILNTRIHLLDCRLGPVPVAAVGALYIGGAGLARGYLSRPRLTAERFIPDPFAPEPGARLYLTGDLARAESDGRLYFLERIDHQVKLRGFRIELGEVRAALEELPAVREAVVVVRQEADTEPHLVAYLVADQRVSAAELRESLRSKLPEYMVPAAFVALESLPLTPNGKIDRRALPAPDRADVRLEGSVVAPRDRWELQIVEIWQELLPGRPIGATSNFFDLGGHSFLAVRVLSRLEQASGRRLALATLFQAPTVAALAGILRRTDSAAEESALVPIQASGDNVPFFWVHPVGGGVFCYQELARQLGPDQPFYGFQAVGLEGGQPPLETIEAMARHYVEELRSSRPAGPYYLGGWSLGALVAFEMARTLRKEGGEVALLALVDIPAPTRRKARRRQEREPLAVLEHFALELGLAVDEFTGDLEALARMDEQQQLAAVREQAVAQNLLPADFDLAEMTRFFRVFQANLGALDRYRPQKYPGRVCFFPAEGGSLSSLAEPTGGWGRLAEQGVEVRPVPGDHHSALRPPHVASLARQLRDVMALAAGSRVELPESGG